MRKHTKQRAVKILNRPKVRFHQCAPVVMPDDAHAYAYCRYCGRALKQYETKKLNRLMRIARTPLLEEEQPIIEIPESVNQA